MKLTIIIILIAGFAGFCKFKTSNDNSHTINLLRQSEAILTGGAGCTWDKSNWDACTISE